MPILNTLVEQEKNCSLLVGSTSSGLMTNSWFIGSNWASVSSCWRFNSTCKYNRIPVIVAANDHNKRCSFGLKSGHRYVRKLWIVGCHSLLLLWSNWGHLPTYSVAQVVLVLSSFHCGQTWNTLFRTLKKKQANCASCMPDHSMQAVLGSHN